MVTLFDDPAHALAMCTLPLTAGAAEKIHYILYHMLEDGLLGKIMAAKYLEL